MAQTISSPPSPAAARRITASVAAASVTSRDQLDRALELRATAPAAAWSRSVTATRAPAAASARAIACPMPVPAPVTRARRPTSGSPA